MIDRFHAAQKADIKISVDDISQTLKTKLSDSESCKNGLSQVNELGLISIIIYKHKDLVRVYLELDP